MNFSFHVWIDNWLFLSSWLFTFYRASWRLVPGLEHCIQSQSPFLCHFYYFLVDWVPECLQEVSALRTMQSLWKKRDKCSQNPPALFQSRHHTLISPTHTCHVIVRLPQAYFEALAVYVCEFLRACLCGVRVSICRMSAWVHAYVLAYHKICKNNAITLTVQQFPSELQLYKNLRYREKYIHCCVLSYRTLNWRNLSYLKSGAFEYWVFWNNLVRVSLVRCFSSVQLSLHEDSFGVPSVLSNIFLLFSFLNIEETLMTRSEGVNTDGGEKRLVGVKMILHILCSAERCMIRKSSSLSFTLAFSPFIFSFAHPPCPFFGRHHSEGVLLRHPVNGLTLNSWSCTLILAIIRGCKRKR